ncbi:hypothetical protein [Ruegeria sp. HKCCSP335]|uniref:hypothetical protein n=1 Tax=Ruegeria sp. HKCCSP335 TaxID=2794833 RepID=UPI001AEA6C59|nr:hypothetical protein [Ruegeria sp. HKCCSP335]
MTHIDLLDWDKLKTSITELLGARRQGWIDLALPRFELIKRKAETPDDLPKNLSIKEKIGEICIYHGSATDADKRTLEFLAQESAFTCESCGNAARKQVVSAFLVTLCVECYHARFPGKRVTQQPVQRYDIASRHPHLVSDTCLTLVPSVGPGWHSLVFRGFNRMAGQVMKSGGDVSVEITDVKDKFGALNLSIRRSTPEIDRIAEEMIREASLTCTRCGYFGQRARSKREHQGLCVVCDRTSLDYEASQSRNSTPLPSTEELLIDQLGPDIAEIAGEMRDWHPLAVLDFILAPDPAEHGRSVVNLVRDGDTAALARILAHLRR